MWKTRNHTSLNFPERPFANVFTIKSETQKVASALRKYCSSINCKDFMQEAKHRKCFKIFQLSSYIWKSCICSPKIIQSPCWQKYFLHNWCQEKVTCETQLRLIMLINKDHHCLGTKQTLRRYDVHDFIITNSWGFANKYYYYYYYYHHHHHHYIYIIVIITIVNTTTIITLITITITAITIFIVIIIIINCIVYLLFLFGFQICALYKINNEFHLKYLQGFFWSWIVEHLFHQNMSFNQTPRLSFIFHFHLYCIYTQLVCFLVFDVN